MAKRDFYESISFGEVGEHVVWNILIKMKRTRSVIDVRQDKGFQEKDIDFLVEDINRQFTPVEVKTDYQAHSTGNITYELSTSGNIGCFEKTEARFIVIYVFNSHTVYFLDVPKLREYVKTANLKIVPMGDNAEGYLLPIDDLLKSKVIVETIDNVK